MNQTKPLQGKRIGIFGKGGAGKSTLTVLLARLLLKRSYPVCVLDADSTNIGLATAFGLPHPEKPLLDLYGGMVFQGGAVSCPVDDPRRLENAELTLEDLPPAYATNNGAGLTLLEAGKIAGQGPGAGCDGPIAKIARDLVIHSRGADPAALLDFKAGFEDSARGVITGLDFGLMVVDPTLASVELAAHFVELVQQIKAHHPPATEHLDNPALVRTAREIFSRAKIQDIYLILNKIQHVKEEKTLRRKLAEKGLEPAAVLPSDPNIPSAWLSGQPVRSPAAERALQPIADQLERAA